MSNLTKAEKQLESKEQADERRRAKEKAKKLQLKEFVAAAIIGGALGAIEARAPTLLTGFGPGGHLKLDYVLAGGGVLLAMRGKNGQREVGSAAAVIGIANLTRPLGTRLASGFGA
jgi:hypothetical protein